MNKNKQNIKDLACEHLLAPGTPSCAGCGALQEIKMLYDIIGEKNVIVNAAGCMSLLSVYPFTPFKGSWLYTAIACAPAGAQGIRDALDILKHKGEITKDNDLQVMVLSGDGSANGIALSATSGAIDRGLDFIYFCYDNESYGNTGFQFSAATPYGAKTPTSSGREGNTAQKKDLFSIWAAHKPAYLATVSGSEPLDMAKKIKKAKETKGPSLLIAFATCPTGWHFPPSQSISMGKLAIKTGIWALKEYINGNIIHTKTPKPAGKRPKVEEYLQLQGRFAHLFQPQKNIQVIKNIQDRVDNYWDSITS